MYSNMSVKNNINNKYIEKYIKKLNKYLFKQNEKVAYAYKNLITNDIITYNLDICFYSASTIKFLVCLYLYEQTNNDRDLLDYKITITKEDYKQGSGIIKYNPEKNKYTIKELIYYTLKYSDNTAYIKLVEYVTPKTLREYGKSINAIHTLEGKDLFGITNAFDMIKYLEKLYYFINEKTLYSNELKNIMLSPDFQIIENKNIDNLPFIRKYGSYGIAYHEVGIVLDNNPYILIILTQKNTNRFKKIFVNKVAKRLNKIHKLLKNE